MFPSWATEPAKIVGYIVSGVILLGAAIVELANELTGVVPHSWQPYVHSGLAVGTGIGLVAPRFQTWFTRNGVGPRGNGKDGVIAPATHAAELEATAIAVAAAKNVDPALHAL